MPEQLPEEATSRVRPFAELIGALRFLTRLPVPFARTVDHVPISQSMRFFPVAGALIGLATAVALVGLSRLYVPPALSVVLAFAVTLAITGALHEDGLADSFDGLVGGKDRDRRLEIMRDSRIGTYGVLALIIAAAAKLSALHDLLKLKPEQLVLVLAAAAAFSRGLMVDVMWATRPARSDGLSVSAGRPSRNTVIFSIVIGAGLVLYAGTATTMVASVYALAASLAVTGLIRIWAIRKIGGQTGDICGAVQVVSEIAILTAFAATLH